MELALRIADDPSRHELASLRTWLLKDAKLRGGAAEVTGGATGPGDMGPGGLEFLNVVLSNSIALGSLITAIATWRASRPRRPAVHIEVNGTNVIVDTDDPETIRAIIESLTRAAAPPT